MAENSPAFQGRDSRERGSSPAGTAEIARLSRPSGTYRTRFTDPALKRRAIVACPFGTEATSVWQCAAAICVIGSPYTPQASRTATPTARDIPVADSIPYNRLLPDTRLVACPHCDLLQRLPQIAPGASARCLRCDKELWRHREDSLNRTLALKLAAAVLYVIAKTVPMLGLTAVGHQAATTVLGGAVQLWIDVQRFVTLRSEAKKNQGVLVEAVRVVRKAAGGVAVLGRTVARDSAQGADYDSLVAAHSRALAQVSAEIAAAIRKEANEKP